MPIFRRFLGSSIESEIDLTRFVFTVAGLCLSAVLLADLAYQFIFFTDWQGALRSWTLAGLLTLSLAIPIAAAVGKTILELYQAKQKAEHLSRTDPLTGLPNRRALVEAVPGAGASAFALVIADIDRFKRVNDAYGHLVGDHVIRAVAEAMAVELGALGLLARVGGEEFALLAPGVDPATLRTRLDAFRERLGETQITAFGESVQVTISAGAAFSTRGTNFDHLYADADRALYAAKACGRNRVLFVDQVEALARPQRQDVMRQARSSA